MDKNTKAQGLVKTSSAILDLIGSNEFSYATPVSFLTKSTYLTNCNPILENPDHAWLFLVFFYTFFFFTESTLLAFF